MAIMLTGVSVPQSAPKGTLVGVLHWYGSGARSRAILCSGTRAASGRTNRSSPTPMRPTLAATAWLRSMATSW